MLNHISSLLADGPSTIAASALFGLLSSVHCVGMCGGIAAAQSAGKGSKPYPIISYSLGRIISYTIIGAVIGLTGAALGLNKYLKAIIPLICGLITIVIGLQQLGLLRWLNVGRKEPENCLAKRFSKLGPFVVGLLTGIMPCGTLQTVQYAALSSGSIWNGAGIMFAFAVTSAPALAAIGLLSAVMTTKGRKIITVIAALVVIFMGLRMVLKGLTMMGAVR